MSEYWYGLLGSATFLAVVGFVAVFFRKALLDRLKLSLKHEFDDRLAIQQNVFDRHLAEVRHHHELDIERLRAELRIDAFRTETRFARLHEKRIEVVAEVFAALNNTRITLAEYANNGVDPDRWPELRKDVFAAIQACYSTFNSSEIYLPAVTAGRIRNYLNESKLNLMHFIQDVDNGGEDRSRFFKTWKQVSENLAGQSHTLFDELRAEFRQLLGDDVQPANEAK